jgi:ubiquinone/menaquinone biosynthesis C-methylase UbiE
MKMTQTLKAGDFTGLAKDYSQHRPDYCPSVLKALLGLLDKPLAEVDFVDVGAGTGIWTRMVNAAGVRSVTAVEPNEDMRQNGSADSQHTHISWLAGSAEATGLADASADWLSMASSFHWAKFDTATKEFHRVLRAGGAFDRIVESQADRGSGITETLTEQLWASPYFEDVVYLEGRHVIEMTPERYLGAWRSVNDLRVQLGPEKFDAFLAFVEQRIADSQVIEATYFTRAWSARRKD